MESNGDGIASAEVNDVAVLQKPLVDLLIVDVRAVRRIPIDQQNLAVHRDDLCMEPRHLWILQYDLTNCRLPPDADAGAAEAEALAGARAVEDRELAEHQRPPRRHARRRGDPLRRHLQ